MNILVVEDESLALDDLLGMLQVFTGAHHVTGVASGAEALVCAEAAPPDLVITDIRMPEIDGLELVRRLKTRAPQLAAIVLSGYSEFEYARRGLRLGIADYLLKPVRTDALRQAVERALGAIAAERARSTHLREAQLVRLLLGGSRATPAEPDLLAGDWCLVIVVCENWESPTLWRDTPVNRDFIAQVVAAEGPRACDIVGLDGRCRVVLVPLPSSAHHALEALALRLHRAIADAGVVVHTTYAHKDAAARPDRVAQAGLAQLAHAMRFAAPTFARPGAAPQDAAGGALREHAQLIARALGEGKPSAAITEVYAALDRLQHARATQAAVIQTLDDAFRLVEQYAKWAGAESLPDREALAGAVRRGRSYEELVTWIDMQLRPLVMRQGGAATPRQLVRALVGLVHSAYAEDISLQAFAAEHNVSLAYFSRLFKDEVGVTFSEYLIRVRIEKAKELLEYRDRRLSDVSALVGYDDPKYFSQIFRKVVGVSPLDYQRTHYPPAQGNSP